MNVYLFELKALLKSAVIWTVVLLCVLLVFMVGIYPMFAENTDDILRMLSGFPPQFTAAFGLDLFSMFSFGGFFGFSFGYIGLVGAIMAAAISLALFSREKRAKCTDFLLTKPVSRPRIAAAKFAAGATALLAANALYIVCCLLILHGGGIERKDALFASLSMLLTQAVFFSMGALYAIVSRKVRSVSGVAVSFGFSGFILSALVSILKEDAVRFAAPLKYFDPTDIFRLGGFDAPYAWTGAAVIVVCLLFSFLLFCQKDTQAM